jgi:predicted GTPase
MGVKIALAGNPNSGKTTLFNALTGSNQFVGNWPGVTVEKKEGKWKEDKEVVIMDLPGIYSLSPYTLEEVVARNYLITERPDAILNIMLNVTDGLVVYPKMIRQRIMRELPFMATENIMMDAVKKGGDRQALHEKIREYSMIAGKHVKEDGLENDLCDMILADPMFMITKEELDAILQPENFTGRSEQQTEEFVDNCIRPILAANASLIGEHYEMKN